MQKIDGIIIETLIWDDWNINHIKERHDVEPSEVEASLLDEYVIFYTAKYERIFVLGRSGNRLITSVLHAQLNDGEYYVVTARDMSKKERVLYRQMKGNNDDK